MSERGETVILLRDDELKEVSKGERCEKCGHLEFFHHFKCFVGDCNCDVIFYDNFHS